MTDGQRRADRIIEQEMLRCGTEMGHARERDYPAWERAHFELCELGAALAAIHGKRAKTPDLEAVKPAGQERAGETLDLF